MKRFAIVTMPRTGSTWLCSALDNHPEIVCDGEVFHGKRIERHSWGRGDEKVNVTTDRDRIKRRNASPKTMMREIEKDVAASGCNVYGFKHILSFSAAGGLSYIIENRDIDVIVLPGLCSPVACNVSFRTWDIIVITYSSAPTSVPMALPVASDSGRWRCAIMPSGAARNSGSPEKGGFG